VFTVFVLCAFLIQRSIAIHMSISRKQACGTGITTGLSTKDMYIHGVISEKTQAFTSNRNVWPKVALL